MESPKQSDTATVAISSASSNNTKRELRLESYLHALPRSLFILVDNYARRRNGAF